MSIYFCDNPVRFYHDQVMPVGHIPAGAIPITDKQHAALLAGQSQGLTIVLDEQGRPGLIEPALPDFSARLAQAYTKQEDLINQACEAAITGGFWSSTLGAPYQYSSQLDDQLNLTGVILAGQDSLYACRDELGTKEFRPHTAQQIRQVGEDFTLFKQQLLQKANTLKQALDQALAAEDLAALQGVAWDALT